MLRFALWTITAICLSLGAWPAMASPLRVGVVQFEEKNQIELENAGTIVAEWMATEMGKIGKFEMAERLLLSKVLEEQKLMLSGVIDENQAVEIGKIYGIQAVVTGAVMKVGEDISVTGRIISVRNGRVIKTANVKTRSLEKLEEEIFVLANALCDIDREQFEISRDIEKRKYSRLEFGGGAGLAYNNSESRSSDPAGFSLEALVRFRSKLATLWICGAPVGGFKNLEFGGTFNISRYLGLGAAWGKSFDDLFNYFEVTYLHFGFLARPRLNMEFSLFIGGALTGVVWTDDERPGLTDPEITGLDGYWAFPDNYCVSVLYGLNEKINLRIRYLGIGMSGFKDKLPDGYFFPSGDREYLGGLLTLSLIYSFPI